MAWELGRIKRLGDEKQKRVGGEVKEGFGGKGYRKGVRQRKVSDVSGPKCGAVVHRAWEPGKGERIEMRHQRRHLETTHHK